MRTSCTSRLEHPCMCSLRMYAGLADNSFDSPQDEAAHYREKYRRILDMLDETRAELGELFRHVSWTCFEQQSYMCIHLICRRIPELE